MIECCKYEPGARPEARLIVRGLKELFQVVKSREGASAAPAVPAAPAAGAASTEAKTASSSSAASPQKLDVVAPKQLRSSSTSSSAPPISPRRQHGAGPYVGLTSCEADEETAKSLPAENGLFRAVYPIASMSSRQGRLRWVQFQDAAPSQCEGWVKIAFSDSSKPAKHYAILMQDVIHYFKHNKKGERSLGRIFLDVQVQVNIVDKGAKKSELIIANGTGETVRLVVSSMEELKNWNTVRRRKTGLSFSQGKAFLGCLARGFKGFESEDLLQSQQAWRSKSTAAV